MPSAAYHYWKHLCGIPGKSNCVPIAISMVEGIPYPQALAACELWAGGDRGNGFSPDTLSLVIGRPLRKTTRAPRRGYASYPRHIAPIIDGRIYRHPKFSGTLAHFYV